MHYTELFTKEQLNKHIEDGIVRVQKHEKHDLYIYNYTQKAQFDWLWDDVTLNCRGLILDGEGNIVARPLKKFFSYEQLDSKLPDGEFTVHEKMDGSLGIAFLWEGELVVATRGSFVSDQAIMGKKLLESDAVFVSQMKEGLTYLFEIIYPENRVVVDYNGANRMVLLAVLDAKGNEYELDYYDKPLTYSYRTVEEMMAHNEGEGFVLKFEDGTRVKIKLEEYKRLHRLLTGVSEKDIWEALMKGGIEKVVEKVPDEFFKWVQDTKAQLEEEYRVIETEAKALFKDLGNRKDNALYYCNYPRYKGILFNMLDGKDYSTTVWRMIKPKANKIFKVVGEDMN